MNQACKSSAALLVRVPPGKSERFAAGWAKADLFIKTHGCRPSSLPKSVTEDQRDGYTARLLIEGPFMGEGPSENAGASLEKHDPRPLPSDISRSRPA